MEVEAFLISWLIILHANLTACEFSRDEIWRLRLETKAELARSLLKRDLSKSKAPEVVNITHTHLEELSVTNSGDNIRIFRSADENFLFTGADLFQIQKQRDSPRGRYTLHAVHDVRLDEGAVFFKNAEWKNKAFLVVCYQKGYCEVRISALTLKGSLKLRIDTGDLPLDVTFFGTDEDFFLVMVLDPVIVYRWTGTYFNEECRLETRGAQSVAVFQDGDKSVFVIAQKLGRSTVYSKVFIRKNNKIELLQLLPTQQALRVLPFALPYQEDRLHFIFVLNDARSSAIFWWTGTEFVHWTDLEKVHGQKIIHVGQVGPEIFFFISDKRKIYVYHPTFTSFDLMQIIAFDQDVVGIDLRKERDQFPILLVLTGSPLDPYFKVNLITLKIVYNYKGKDEVVSDGVLACLGSVKKELESRREKLKEILAEIIDGTKTTGEAETEVNVASENLSRPPLDEMVAELTQKVTELEERVRNFGNETFEDGRLRRYHVHGDLIIDQMEADAIDVEILNGKLADFENFLSITDDQTFSGKIDLDTLETDVLNVPSLNGISVQDFLVRNKKVQRITGDYTLESLTMNGVQFGSSAKINGLPVTDMVASRAPEKPIRGHKVFSKLKVNQIQADKINNIPARDWLAKILPSLKDATEEEPLNFTGLAVEKLWISKLNGIPWDDFVRSIYLPTNEGTIKGNLTVTGTAKIRNLRTKMINGIPLGKIDSEMVRNTKTGGLSCKASRSNKTSKALPFNNKPSPDWDDSFLKEILNEPESKFENNVKYFFEPQKLIGDIRAAKIFVKNPIQLSDTYVNLANFTETFWMKNQNQTIRVPVEFTNGLIANTVRTESVNGKPLDSFVWIDRPNVVLSDVIFENAEIGGNVTLDESVETNVDWMGEPNAATVVMPGQSVVLSQKRFSGTVTAARVNVNILNGADANDLDDLLLNHLKSAENVEVSELLIGGDLKVENGVDVKVINEMNFNETISKILTWDDPNVLSKAHYKALNVENLNAVTINGWNVEDELSKLSKNQKGNVTVVVKGNFKIPRLRATKINGANFDEFLNQVFRKDESQLIKGEKIFKETVTVTGNLRGTLNKYNVTELERTALSKSKAQNITAVYTVGDLKTNDVEVKFLNGIRTDEFLFQDETAEQVINSDVVFSNVAVAGDIEAVNLMNGCDPLKAIEVDLEKVSDIDTLEVRDDVTWDNALDEPCTLNYVLENAVTTDEDEIISGSVTFENDVEVNSVKGSRHFNDIDLSLISADAVFKSRSEQEIPSSVTFKGRVTANSFEVLDRVLVDTINDIDITDIGQRLVRKSADTVVKGRKIFKNGFTANRLNADTINGVRASDIVFYDDVHGDKMLELPPATFKNLIVFNDLTVSRVNGYSLDEILREKLSKTEDESVHGRVRVEGNVIIKGDANIGRINDVNMNETVLMDGEDSSKIINGDIEFLDTISVDDGIQVDYINGQNITELYKKALMVDTDAVLEGNIEFLSNVTINGNIYVNDTVNNCSLSNIPNMDGVDSADDARYQFRDALKKEVNFLKNLTSAMGKSLIFMYLEEVAVLDLQLPTMHGSAVNYYKDVIEFNMYGMKHGRCGLPSECYCPTQTNVFIQSMDPATIRVDVNSTRFFKYYDDTLRVEVMVTTNTVSYSARCKKSDPAVDREHSSISWRNFENDETIYEVNVETGFLSDVKFFRLGDSIYVVMAFYFHPSKNQTNNVYTVVYELQVTNKVLEKVDEIPSSEVQVLEVFWTVKGVILVVGNSIDSDRFTDSVNSGVYRFNEYTNKFELLRFVKTHGILTIKSMRYKKTSFIFFVQKQSWPLLVLKYNDEYDNYYFSQKLDTTRSLVRSNFLSVAVISTEFADRVGDVFVGIVLSDDNFRLFRHKHIEGFVEESYQEQNNVRILHPFWMGSTQYLLAGSALDSSKIYKLVKQGL